MSTEDWGPAAVLVYGDGRLEAALFHACDGGESYMGPLVRKAVQYARTHYDSGNILDVLMSEGEMIELDAESTDTVLAECRRRKVRHVYYVGYWWNAGEAKKTYRVWSAHVDVDRAGSVDVVPFLSPSAVPKTAGRLV